MSLIDDHGHELVLSRPRVSGDEPVRMGVVAFLVTSTPRERG